MAASIDSRTPRGRAVREIVLFGIAGGVLLAVLKLTEYRPYSSGSGRIGKTPARDG